MTRYPWHAHLLLLAPARVDAALDRLRAAGVPRVPNLWQIELGVLRMWHRIVFRSNTVGLSSVHPVRPGWRARLLAPRPLRFPFLLWEGSVAFWDLSGLLSSPERLERHLLGTHHEGVQFIYDLEILRTFPGALERLAEEARAVVEQRTPRSEWLRDLVVFERYHETLLDVVERALAGQDPALLSPEPDISFRAYLDWCFAQPETPRDTLARLREGRYHPQHGVAHAA